MLIRIIDLFDPIQGVFQTTTPALVWLQPLNEYLMFWEQIANHAAPVSEFHSFEVRYEAIPSSPFPSGLANEKYGELGVRCRCCGFQQGKLIYEAVKGRSEIVGNLTNANTPIEEKWRSIRLHAIDLISRLRIQLGPDYAVWRVLPERTHGLVKNLDFTFCAPYLETRAIKALHKLYSNHEGQEDGDTKNTQGPRDSGPDEGRRIQGAGKGGGANQAKTISESNILAFVTVRSGAARRALAL